MDVTNRGEKKRAIDKFFSVPKLGFIEENIPLSQKHIGTTIPGYFPNLAIRQAPLAQPVVVIPE
eukprot:13028344-Heterocapsa_arctica.AAC.1